MKTLRKQRDVAPGKDAKRPPRPKAPERARLAQEELAASDAACLMERYLALQKAAKEAYAEMDTLMERLINNALLGHVYTLPNGKQALFKDQYAVKNKVWKATCVQRYTVEEIGGSK